MASFRKRGKRWYFRHIAADGTRPERPGCPDRRATEEMARAAETEAAKIRAGLIDPKAERLAAAGRLPIGELLEAFIAAMRAKGDDPKHVGSTKRYAMTVLELAAIGHVPELKPSAVMEAIGRLKADGLSARTLNAYLTAVKSFARWLHRDGRSADHPLACLSRINEAGERRLIRRPLTDGELRRLIEATRTAPAWKGMPGPDRAMLYLIGAATGFRHSEMASLRPESFRLASEPPTIVCEAAYTKNGRVAEQPVTPALSAALTPWLATKPGGGLVFDTLPEKTGQMLKADLTRCGIDPVDASGRGVDLHSLRHGYITTLAKAGVPIKTLQTLARHSDPKLTLGVYTHVTIHDTAAALDALPDLTAPDPRPEAPRMTGTAPGMTPISNGFAPHLPHGGDGLGRIVAEAGGIIKADDPPSMSRNPLETEGFDASGRVVADAGGSAPRRTRTFNPLIKSQLLCQLS